MQLITLWKQIKLPVIDPVLFFYIRMPFRGGHFSSAEKLWVRKYTDCQKMKHLMHIGIDSDAWKLQRSQSSGTFAQSSRKIGKIFTEYWYKALWNTCCTTPIPKKIHLPKSSIPIDAIFFSSPLLAMPIFPNWNSTRKYALIAQGGSLSQHLRNSSNSLQVQLHSMSSFN